MYELDRSTIETTVQRRFIPVNPGELAQQLSETLTHYATLIVLKFFTSTPNLFSYTLQSNSESTS